MVLVVDALGQGEYYACAFEVATTGNGAEAENEGADGENTDRYGMNRKVVDGPDLVGSILA
jgi:hypothetical protein